MIRRILMENVGVVINDFTSIGDSQFEKVNRKKASFLKRDAKLLKVGATGKVHTIDKQLDDTEKVTYSVHYTYFIKHGNHYYLEEEVESRKAVYYGGVIYEDVEEPIPAMEPAMEPGVDEEEYEGGEDSNIAMTGTRRFNMRKNGGTAITLHIKNSRMTVRTSFHNAFMLAMLP
ncbi:hypothetical protein ACPJHQ_08825 [Rossellomorea sp. H39__3]